jgi:hypothetical protein
MSEQNNLDFDQLLVKVTCEEPADPDQEFQIIRYSCHWVEWNYTPYSHKWVLLVQGLYLCHHPLCLEGCSELGPAVVI